jgi:hypothetical protein
MKKKKEIKDIIKNGRDFKLIITKGSDENVISVMEKPNVKAWTQKDFNILASGAHVFAINPKQNHIDFFLSGSQVYKKYPEVRGSTNYGYIISGGGL